MEAVVHIINNHTDDVITTDCGLKMSTKEYLDMIHVATKGCKDCKDVRWGYTIDSSTRGYIYDSTEYNPPTYPTPADSRNRAPAWSAASEPRPCASCS